MPGDRKKYPRLTKPLYCILTLICWLLFANPGQAQDAATTKISLQVQQQPLSAVFREIEQKSGLTIEYRHDVINKDQLVSIRATDEPVQKVLRKLLNGTAVRLVQQGKSILLVKDPATAPANSTPPAKGPGRFSGRIIDEETGEVLPGVTIRIGTKGATSAANGGFMFALPAGRYEAEISSIGYSKKIVSDIIIKDDQLFDLNISLKKTRNTLTGVVVRSSARKESVNALYLRQKNEAGISNGISREQIAALPDKNVGETLKRISGVSTNDNRRVVVRGIAERYNLAMMDGAVLPSTDVQVRDFEFDIVPSNLIDNVVVSKTATPDMSFGFGGGLIQINTFAIPNENFNTFSIGTKYTDGSTGKDFLGYARGKQDYLGFDDGGREHFPKEMLIFNGQNYDPKNPNNRPNPNIPGITPAMIAENNRKIGGLERIGTRTYKAAPGQNYQFSMGRSYTYRNNHFGFVGSLSYRNEQSIDDISHFGRGNWEKLNNRVYKADTGEEVDPTYSTQYNFNTTWGALLNMGWSSKNHKITVRNFYSRVFNNQFSRIVGWGNDIGYGEHAAIREYDRPRFVDLLQNRINGEHNFGAFRLEWNVARNKLVNLEKDAVEAWLAPSTMLNGTVYNIMPSGVSNPGGGTFNRAKYIYEETNKIAEGSLSYRFNVLGKQQIVKSGYQYMQRHGTYDWTLLPIGTVEPTGNIYPYIPVQEWGKYLEFKDPAKDLFYYPAGFSQNGYEGKNTNQAVYGMLDNRFTNWLRLVWGVRAEYYKYERMKSGANDLAINSLIEQGEKLKYVDPASGNIVAPFADPTTEEKTWRYLPSASLTATPLKDFNIRAAYSQSVVRPALIENSRMIRYDPLIAAYRKNEGVLSTLIDHYDFRMEWYPNPGEVISVGYFHKYFDKPVELYRTQPDATARIYLNVQNSDWAKVDGLEVDLRKGLGFLRSDWKFLDNIFVSANLTLQTSEVQASTFVGKAMTEDKYGKNYQYRTKVNQKEKRPLYGQVPVLYNVALQYTGNRLGANVAFNHMGYKTFTTGLTPHIVEYERPRDQLDAQLSYNFLKDKRLKARLSISNILNTPHRFYINGLDTYKKLAKWEGVIDSGITAEEWSEIYEWKPGFSQKYEEGHLETSSDGKTKTRVGDKETFIRKTGVAFSLSLSYSF
ncbi:TonB-dependent receptor [Chitinophaga sp. Mgbs1]|uniref:TonB-dependent receptor n=1 Tax=Chitinophaga solisilvae TaxID=1233460 RepID=A0A433WLG4_9BACT|nr:TonB-dependent receptor [Chitinophaga solisilvae]